MITTHSKANRSIPVFMDFLIFFHVPFSIKLVFPKKAQIKVSLMVTLIVRAFERVEIRFLLFCFESKRTDLEVQFATSHKMLVMLTLV